MTSDLILFLVFYWFVCGIVAGAIAVDRDRSFWGFFFLTFLFLGPLGIAVALLAAPLSPTTQTRPIAAGRRRFTGPRCGAENDIPENDTSYDCWRCSEHRKVKPKADN
jgi:hypothetical protein